MFIRIVRDIEYIKVFAEIVACCSLKYPDESSKPEKQDIKFPFVMLLNYWNQEIKF